MKITNLLLPFLIIFNFSSVFAQNGAESICPIRNSSEVPDVTVVDTGGSSIQLKDYIAERPVVLVFYRGAWCPYCIRHLSALHEVKDEIDSLGYELIAITSDRFTNLDSAEIRSSATDFTLFSDSDFTAMEAFGIGWEVSEELYLKYKEKYGFDLEWWSGSEKHILPVPSVFIIKDSVIRYQHVDPQYKQRLSPKVLLSFLED